MKYRRDMILELSSGLPDGDLLNGSTNTRGWCTGLYPVLALKTGNSKKEGWNLSIAKTYSTVCFIYISSVYLIIDIPTPMGYNFVGLV